jgi:sulfatase modifying factor 1
MINQSHVDFQAYAVKMGELHEMLKFSIYTEKEILEKIRHIQLFAQMKTLDINPIDEDLILMIARDLQPFYDYLWTATSTHAWQVQYQRLNPNIRKLYAIYEVERDWVGRQSSKRLYETLLMDLENGVYWANQLVDRINHYQAQQIFYADRPSYFLNVDTVIKQYEHRLLIKEMRSVEHETFDMIRCPSGAFLMGSDDVDSLLHERPKHLVKIKQGFWISETTVTQNLWRAVMKWNPSSFKGSGQLPVEHMTWYDCLIFCNRLSVLHQLTPCFVFSKAKREGHHTVWAKVEWLRHANGYRLPTEAEWEYCAKANQGFIYSGSNEIDDVAWYAKNAQDHDQEHAQAHRICVTHEVKMKQANAWGLYDMSGNVWEWCMDRFDVYANQNSKHAEFNENYEEHAVSWCDDHCLRAVRGGAYGYDADLCRNTMRYGFEADYRFDCRGFRLVRGKKDLGL